MRTSIRLEKVEHDSYLKQAGYRCIEAPCRLFLPAMLRRFFWFFTCLYTNQFFRLLQEWKILMCGIVPQTAKNQSFQVLKTKTNISCLLLSLAGIDRCRRRNWRAAAKQDNSDAESGGRTESSSEPASDEVSRSSKFLFPMTSLLPF